MDWFFTDSPGKPGDTLLITGEDAVHIPKSLRMSAAETKAKCSAVLKRSALRVFS